MNPFDVENQYQLYLKRMALKESEMHPEQKRQLRQAFFGATGQILMLLRDEAPKLDEGEMVNMIERMVSQVLEFFLTQVRGSN